MEIEERVMLIGYTRPLQNDPKSKKQVEVLSQKECNIIISEKHASAKKRIELDKLINNLQENDKIIVTKLYSIADSTLHLVELIELIESKGAYFESICEGIDTGNIDGYQFSYILNHLAEFQSDVISEKTKKGLYKARQKGVIAGRPRKPDKNVQRAIDMYKSKEYSLAEITSETGISKSTLYRYLEK